MSNNTPPKEIYVSEFVLAVLSKDEQTTIYINKVKQSDQIAYLSEQSVNEMLAEKDKEIEHLKKDENLESIISEIEYTKGLYDNKRFTNAELSFQKLTEQIKEYIGL